MYSALTRYGAVTAKVRAMYGRMLKPSEWESIGAMRNLSDISSFIRSHPGWQEAGELIPQGCRDERLIEKSLHTQLENEYERIYRFATREDKRFLIFSVYRTEYRGKHDICVRTEDCADKRSQRQAGLCGGARPA